MHGWFGIDAFRIQGAANELAMPKVQVPQFGHTDIWYFVAAPGVQ
ncbi:hypothetical protein FG91_03574 [Sphingopyxis sp. LC81]|nr:hypothetical protein FG91_03574 [Sphingopyxis sp. LC81]